MFFEVNIVVPAQGEYLFEAVAIEGNNVYHYNRKFYDSRIAGEFVKAMQADTKAGNSLDSKSWIKFSH
jgi:hypothetical protein